MHRRKEMSALLARRERDGRSLRRLSNETGIPIGTLSWWSWRLRAHRWDEKAGLQARYPSVPINNELYWLNGGQP